MQKPSFNQIANTQNPYQGDAVKALCVCSAGLLRSPTIAKVLTERGYNARAAGMSQEYALIPVTPALIAWADEIHVVAEQEDALLDALTETRESVGGFINYKEPVVYVYNIPDMYPTFDKELVRMIEEDLYAKS